MDAETLDAQIRSLRELSDWLIANDLDMKLPDNITNPDDAADTLATLKARCEALEGALQEIEYLSGEINPSNYSHEDACYLNQQFCYALTTASAALASNNTKDTKEGEA